MAPLEGEPVTPDEYVLTLRTGERLEVSEFAYERIPGLMEEVARLGELVRGCTVVTRRAVESAKRGDDAELCKALRDPKAGMLKTADPECSQRKDCAMFDRDVCTSRNLGKRKPVPICYEHAAGLLAGAVVLASSAGRRVLIVVPDPQALRSAPG
jgi:hypothetical protein